MISHEIRELRIADILALHKFYDSLPEQDKCFFHPGFVGFESINLIWILAQFAMAASTLPIKKLILRFCPFAFVPVIMSIDNSGKITGFAFTKFKIAPLEMMSIAEIGICVDARWQGKRIGTKLIERLLELAKRSNLQMVCLSVLAENTRAIRLYEKNGFIRTRTVQKFDVWRGKRLDSIEMCLRLD